MSTTQLDNNKAAEASVMSTPMISRFERWAPMAGIVFVLLMVGGGFLVSDVPNSDATEQEIAGYLADGDNHTRNIVGAYLWVIGALAFLCFLTRLRGDLRRAEGGKGRAVELGLWRRRSLCRGLDGFRRRLRVGGLCRRAERCSGHRP